MLVLGGVGMAELLAYGAFEAPLGPQSAVPALCTVDSNTVNGLCLAGCAGHASVHAIAAPVLGGPVALRVVLNSDDSNLKAASDGSP